MSDSNARITDDELQAIRVRLASGFGSRLEPVVEALLQEVAACRLNEESWAKEAARHDRDHQDHYTERERLRTELDALQDAVRAAFGDLWWAAAIKPMPLDEMLIRARHRLRHDHEEKCGIVVENLRQARRELADANAKLDADAKR